MREVKDYYCFLKFLKLNSLSWPTRYDWKCVHVKWFVLNSYCSKSLFTKTGYLTRISWGAVSKDGSFFINLNNFSLETRVLPEGSPGKHRETCEKVLSFPPAVETLIAFFWPQKPRVPWVKNYLTLTGFFLAYALLINYKWHFWQSLLGYKN